MRSSARTARFSPHARAAVNRGTSGGPSGVVGCAQLAGIREFGFELVEPFAVRGEELACEPMREHEVACAVWDLLDAVLAISQLGVEEVNLVAQGTQAGEDRLVVEEVAGDQPQGGLVLHAGEARGFGETGAQRAATGVRERVVPARRRFAGPALGVKEPEPG